MSRKINVTDPLVRLELYKKMLEWVTERPRFRCEGLCDFLAEKAIYQKTFKDIDPEDDLPEMQERRTTRDQTAWLWYSTDERTDALTDAIKEMEELKEKGKLK